MTRIRDRLKAKAAELLHAESGATAIEYALLSALIACAILLSLTAIGSSLTGTYSNVSAALDLTQAGGSGAGGGNGNGNNGNGKGGNGNGNNGNGKGNGGPKGGG